MKHLCHQRKLAETTKTKFSDFQKQQNVLQQSIRFYKNFWKKTWISEFKFSRTAISLKHFELSIFDRLLFFSTNYHDKRQIIQLYWCRVKRPVQKTWLCNSWAPFDTKKAEKSDQSVGVNFSRRFHYRLIFEYYVAFASFAILLTFLLTHSSESISTNLFCQLELRFEF